jgi:hypothetical protein
VKGVEYLAPQRVAPLKVAAVPHGAKSETKQLGAARIAWVRFRPRERLLAEIGRRVANLSQFTVLFFGLQSIARVRNGGSASCLTCEAAGELGWSS